MVPKLGMEKFRNLNLCMSILTDDAWRSFMSARRSSLPTRKKLDITVVSAISNISSASRLLR